MLDMQLSALAEKWIFFEINELMIMIMNTKMSDTTIDILTSRLLGLWGRRWVIFFRK